MTTENIRQLVAEESARLLFEEGYRDYMVAKQKAASRLGVSLDKHNQPTNTEVHQAILLRRELLGTTEDEQHLQQMRQVAVEAMEFLERYQPLLTGGVVDGAAGKHSPITIHLFADAVEEVMFFLEDNKIPFQPHERKTRIHGKSYMLPLLRFFADDYEIELMVFNAGDKHSPVSPVTGKAMKRLNIGKVKKLLE